MFSEYGSLCHEILEKYFRGELEAFQLADYYADNYDRMVVSSPPFFIKTEEYYNQGYKFFDTFDFDKDEYEVLVIEDKVDVDLEDLKLIVKPDLVLKHKETGKVYLMDYKSSIVQKGDKIDEKKLAGYKKQLTLYCKHLKSIGVHADYLQLWFFRQKENKIYTFEVTEEDETKVDKWVARTVKKIRSEEKFEATTDKFFCGQLCGVRDSCSFKPK
jgi:hypothetical protein